MGTAVTRGRRREVDDSVGGPQRRQYSSAGTAVARGRRWHRDGSNARMAGDGGGVGMAATQGRRQRRDDSNAGTTRGRW